MQHILERTIETKTPWFESWFDSPYYHLLYGNRDENEAAGFINKLIYLLNPSPGSSMLDVGCGTGRHCRQLASKGFEATGLDLSINSITEAQKNIRPGLRYFQHDMRKPFGNNQFDYVFNFFTSFGYFKTESENFDVIMNMFKALKPGGMLVMDYLNIYFAEDRLVSLEEKTLGDITFTIKRWTDYGHFFKQITINGPALPQPAVFTEQVERLTLADFRVMFALNNLELVNAYGDYELGAFDRRNSPRLIMQARKN